MSDLFIVGAFGLILFSPCVVAMLVVQRGDEEPLGVALRGLLRDAARPVRVRMGGLGLALFAPAPSLRGRRVRATPVRR